MNWIETIAWLIEHAGAIDSKSVCADCGNPQPPEGSLHDEDCPAHNEDYCVVCKEEQQNDEK